MKNNKHCCVYLTNFRFPISRMRLRFLIGRFSSMVTTTALELQVVTTLLWLDLYIFIVTTLVTVMTTVLIHLTLVLYKTILKT